MFVYNLKKIVHTTRIELNKHTEEQMTKLLQLLIIYLLQITDWFITGWLLEGEVIRQSSNALIQLWFSVSHLSFIVQCPVFYF